MCAYIDLKFYYNIIQTHKPKARNHFYTCKLYSKINILKSKQTHESNKSTV